MNRREFLQVLAAAAGAGLPLMSRAAQSAPDWSGLYDAPTFGNVHFLHITDSHAQLKPIHFREPSVNLGLGDALNRAPHLVGSNLLKQFGLKPGTAGAHAFSCMDFESAAQRYGKVGGYAHLATLVKQQRASRPGALLLDGGDTWQGSGTALWTNAQDMVDTSLLLGVDVMTAHWEFTLGAARVNEIVGKDFKDRVAFVAQNIRTADFGDPVFPAYSMREMNGVPVAVIGQAFPYTPIANPAHFIPDWSFGIQDENLQTVINEARGKGAKIVVLLSHNGMDVDLKLATRVRGLDAILGGHTHDGVPQPIVVNNAGGQTLVTNAGSNGKFLGVLDFEVKDGKPAGWKYRLLPVFADALKPDADMAAMIERIRKPYEAKLAEVLATTTDTLYRRGNFNGSFDQLILDALIAEKDAQIAFSPGFRWGTSLLPGSAITMENLLDQTAMSYPQTTLTEMTGERIKVVLEDVADNLFNPDPYLQQGGDMVRVGGLSYAIEPGAAAGKRIQDMRLNGKPIDAGKNYKVAGWAPVVAGVQGEPVWDVVGRWLRAQKTVSAKTLNQPKLLGISNNQGLL
ncbi:MAG: thiosulfohydrolase SoxB [Panacagrimonas sp.]